jgi:hypothetical protein
VWRVTFLPILRRELSVAARRTATYRSRVIFGALAVGLVAIHFMFLPQTRLSGPQLFRFISWMGFVLCLLEGLRSTADSIALERREGTLGLLLLTDVRGYHVVLGKFSSSAMQSLTFIVSMLPAFSLPLLIGGVTAGECGRVTLALLVTLLFALCIGTFISTFTTGALTAFALGGIAVMASFLPSVFVVGLAKIHPLMVALGGPLLMFTNAPETNFDPHNFWLSTAFSGLICAALFVFAGLLLHYFPRLDAPQVVNAFQRWLRPDPGRAESWGGASARTSPGVWLAERTLPGRQMLWLLIIAGVITCFLIGCFAGKQAVACILVCELLFAFCIKLWLAAVAPLSLNASRRGGALELLLCTPLSSAELVRGQVDALYGYFLGPALVIAVGFTVAGVTGMSAGHNASGLRADGSPFAFGLFWFMLFVLDLHALAYTGLWNGLTHSRLDRAIAKTVFSVLILPWLTVIIPIVGCAGMVAWPIFWIYWSSEKLKQRFREEAVKHFSQGADESGWLPWSRTTAV